MIKVFSYTEFHREAQSYTKKTKINNVLSVQLCGSPAFLCVSSSFFSRQNLLLIQPHFLLLSFVFIFIGNSFLYEKNIWYR
jgi:hypothetical protein